MTDQLHPDCLHGTTDHLGYAGVECCICTGSPCEAVTVPQMAAHREFDIAVYSGGLVAPF